jgi:hypothetical protein
MKVKDLQELLAKLDQNLDVHILWENGADQNILGVTEVSVSKGTSVRRPDGNVGFTFGQNGQAAWAFITVDRE